MSIKKKTQRIVTIGGATQDIFLHYQGADCMKIMEHGGEKNYMLFESGAKIEVEKILSYSGGGATNSAVSFSRQGFDVSCCCIIGKDEAGTLVIGDLLQARVNIEYVAIRKELETGVSFVVNSLNRERTIFAYRGANANLKLENIPFEAIKTADQLYITSLSNGAANVLKKVVEFAKKHHVPVAINPGISQLSKGAMMLKDSLKYIDVLILNQSEAKTFMVALVASDKKYKKVFESEEKPVGCFGGKFSDAAHLLCTPQLHENAYFNLAHFFKEVMKMGPKTVVVTDGGRGVYVATGKHIFFHPSLHVDVIDTLGAGDAYGSCFVGSLVKGFSVQRALRRGIINSASVISYMGAKPGLLSGAELQKRERLLKNSVIQQYAL